MPNALRALAPVAAIAGLLCLAAPAAAALAPAPTTPWATPNGRVLTIARANGVVYVGGKFTQVTDTDGTVLPRNHIVAVSAADGHVLPWNPGANDTVRALAISTDGRTLYIGGDFTSLGGAARTRLAAEATIAASSLTTTGTLRPWRPAADGSVYAIAQLGAKVYLGGTFLHVNGHGRPRLAAATAATGALAGWHPKADGAVRALLPSPTGSVIFAGGAFKMVNGGANPHLVALDPTTGRLHPWRSHPPDSILSLAESATTVYAGDSGGGGHVRAFVLSTGRARWTQTTDGNVDTLALVGRGSNQRLVIGGHFTRVGAQTRHKVAALDAVTGKVDTAAGAWHPAAAGASLGVYSELAYGDVAYFGGDFVEWQTHPTVVEQAHLAAFATTATADTTPPAVHGPSARVALGASLGTTSVPLTVTWSAGDPGSGICRYQVQRRFGSRPFVAVPLLLARSTAATTSADPAAHPYTFRAQATDCSDNTSAFVAGAPVTLTAYQNSSRTIAYRGPWSGLHLANAYGGTVRRTGRAGASATMRFSGRELAWVASVGPGYGSAKVLIDGHAAGVVHLHAARTFRRRVVFTRSWQTDGAHTIRIVVVGTHGHPLVELDSLLTVR